MLGSTTSFTGLSQNQIIRVRHLESRRARASSQQMLLTIRILHPSPSLHIWLTDETTSVFLTRLSRGNVPDKHKHPLTSPPPQLGTAGEGRGSAARGWGEDLSETGPREPAPTTCPISVRRQKACLQGAPQRRKDEDTASARWTYALLGKTGTFRTDYNSRRKLIGA